MALCRKNISPAFCLIFGADRISKSHPVLGFLGGNLCQHAVNGSQIPVC